MLSKFNFSMKKKLEYFCYGYIFFFSAYLSFLGANIVDYYLYYLYFFFNIIVFHKGGKRFLYLLLVVNFVILILSLRILGIYFLYSSDYSRFLPTFTVYFFPFPFFIYSVYSIWRK